MGRVMMSSLLPKRGRLRAGGVRHRHLLRRVIYSRLTGIRNFSPDQLFYDGDAERKKIKGVALDAEEWDKELVWFLIAKLAQAAS